MFYDLRCVRTKNIESSILTEIFLLPVTAVMFVTHML